MTPGKTEKIRAALMEMLSDRENPLSPEDADRAREGLAKLKKVDVSALARSESLQPKPPGIHDPDPSGRVTADSAETTGGFNPEPITRRGRAGGPVYTDPRTGRSQQGSMPIRTELESDNGLQQIVGSAMMSPIFKTGGMLLRAGAEKLLASEGGQAAQTAARSVPAAEDIAAAKAEEAALRSEVASRGSLNPGGDIDLVAARNPAVAEALAAPSAMEAEALAIQRAKDMLRFRLPHFSAHQSATGAAASAIGQNATALAGRAAPLAQGVMNAGPLTTPGAALLMSGIANRYAVPE